MKMRIAVLAILIATPLFAADGACPATWGYDSDNGPDRWGQMQKDWALCDSGLYQSPIDITGVKNEPLPKITIDYGSIPLTVQNTGHEIKVPLGFGGIEYGTRKASLVQFHFHVPGEHAINGKHAAAELHLVHEDADGKGIAIGVLIDEQPDDNPALQSILAIAPDHACTSAKSGDFDPRTLLPSVAHYFTYNGSLTTPPCSQPITWLVLREHIGASAAQIEKLKVDHGNARPLQPKWSRRVIRGN